MFVEGEAAANEQNEASAEFFKGADLLVHDCQYTQAEYEGGKLGWGHSSFESTCPAAAKAGVKRLALFHHEPLRSDDQIDELTKALSTDEKGEQ